MKRFFLILAGLVLAHSSTASAQNKPMLFDGALYGRSFLPLTQSTGNSADIVAQNRATFEPLHELDANDPLRIMSRPVGRVDILQVVGRKRSLATCTGALLRGDYVLTNAHCVPDPPARKMSILMDYLKLDAKGKRYTVSIEPIEISRELDYAILKVHGRPTRTYGYLHVSSTEALPNQSLKIFHHPMGRPKVMSRFRCLAHSKQVPGNDMRHRCDTLPGSSGSLMFNVQNQTVGLHHLGGLTPNDDSSFNSAVRATVVIKTSALLQRLLAQQPQSKQPAGSTAKAPATASTRQSASPGTTTRRGADNPGEINSIINRE